MRKIAILILALAAVAAADPFNTIPAWTTDPGSGWAGPYAYATFPVGDTIQEASLTPYFYFGYGILSRFDVTVFAGAELTGGQFSFGDLVVEPKYMFVARDKFLLSGVLEASFPLYEGGSFALIPGLMTTLFPLSSFNLHADLFYFRPLTASTNGEVWLWAAPDYWLVDNFSIFMELNAYYALDDNSFTLEVWPGACWYPTDWLGITASCGVPATLDYLSPGLAAYISF